MSLPSDLLEAVAAPGGGKITLIVGAGCSFEAPTSIPLARTCSQESHDRLVADCVLAPDDCPEPQNLSHLADTVVEKTHGQRSLVEQLSQHYPLRLAIPNEGHELAAALLRERAIASIVTLNFDLALSTAIGNLGDGDIIGIIEGPDDLPKQKTVNLYYLHRNVNTPDPEKWILRTEAIRSEWQGRWESVIAAKVLSAPVVIFAGLGSPADVLIESIKLIQKAIPTGFKVFQVDPDDFDKSEFFEALALDPSVFIKSGWCEFMAALSQRLVVEHTDKLRTAAAKIVELNRLTPEDITPLLDRIKDIGLLRLGRLRANWLLHEDLYCPDEKFARELIADLLLAAAMITRVAGAIAILCDEGIVEFRRGDRIVANCVFVSGRGSRSRNAIESELSARRRRFRGRPTPPTGAIIAATQDVGIAEVTTPPDLILGELSESILFGQDALPIFQVKLLRRNPDLCKEIAP